MAKKLTIFLAFSILSIIVILSLTSAAAPNPVIHTYNSVNPTIVVVFSSDFSSMDYESAKLIKNNLLFDYNIKLVEDKNFIDDGVSNVISVGGSCVNRISARIMNLNYPTCGNIASGQYSIRKFSISNNRWAVVVAGYSDLDTWNAAVQFANQPQSYIPANANYQQSTASYNYATTTYHTNTQTNTYPTTQVYVSTTPSQTYTAPTTSTIYPFQDNTRNYHFINIENLAFSPSTITINQGDVIMWTNYDNVQHTITSDSGSELSSKLIDHGNVYSHEFDSPGTYTYHCSVHTNMHGTIIVNAIAGNNNNGNTINAANTNYSADTNSANSVYKSAYDYSSIINTNTKTSNNYQKTNTNQGYVKVYYYVYYHTPDDYALAYKYVPRKVIYNDYDGDYQVYTTYSSQNYNSNNYQYQGITDYPGYGKPMQYPSSNNPYQITNNYIGLGYLQSTDTSQNLQDTTTEHPFQGDSNQQFTNNLNNPNNQNTQVVYTY